MSSTILLADDLQINMFITIFRGTMEHRDFHTPQGIERSIKETSLFNSFKGRVMRILIIDLPYVVVEYYIVGLDKLEKISLDIREVQLKKCSNRYVEIYEPKFETSEEETVPAWKFEQEEK